jgi:hypothetical protein
MASTTEQFGLGDRVRVKAENPAGNPRTPPYIRGKTGQVVELHGLVANPLDHREEYPPMYTVQFTVADVFGGTSADKLTLEIHQEWLEPA